MLSSLDTESSSTPTGNPLKCTNSCISDPPFSKLYFTIHRILNVCFSIELNVAESDQKWTVFVPQSAVSSLSFPISPLNNMTGFD